MSLSRTIILNTASQIAGQGVSYLLGIATAMMTMRYLGPEQFGTYSLVLVYVGIFGSFAELGGQVVLIREINQRPAESPAIIGNYLLLKLVLTAVVFGFGLLLIAALGYDARMRCLLMLGLMAMLLSAPSAAGAVFQARLKIWFSAGINLVAKAIGLAAVLAMIHLRTGVELLLWGNIVIAVLSSGVALWLVAGQERLSFRPDLSIILELLRESIPIGGLMILGGLVFRADALLLSILTDTRQLGLYSAAYRFVDWGLLLTGSLLVLHLPLFSQFVGSDHGKMRLLYERSLDLLCWLLIPAAVLGGFVSRDLLAVICGREYTSASAALTVLLWVILLNSVNSMAVNILLAMKNQRILLLIYGTVVAVNIALNYVGIPRFGYVCCAWTSVLSEVIALVWSQWLLRRQLDAALAFAPVGNALLFALVAAAPLLFMRGTAPIIQVTLYLSIWLLLQLVFGGLRKRATMLAGWWRGGSA